MRDKDDGRPVGQQEPGSALESSLEPGASRGLGFLPQPEPDEEPAAQETAGGEPRPPAGDMRDAAQANWERLALGKHELSSIQEQNRD